MKALLVVVLSLVVSPATSQKMLVPSHVGPLSGDVYIVCPGHGGKDPGSHWQFGADKQVFWEASYTYPISWEFGQKLAEKGALVYFTTFSPSLMSLNPNSAQKALPLPRDARFVATGKQVVAGTRGNRQRMNWTQKIWKTYHKTRRVVYLAIHIDAMPPGWKGAHVCVDTRTKGSPWVARVIADELAHSGNGRRHDGQAKAMVAKERNLYDLNHRHNPVPERALIELGTPIDQNDSWRIRDREARGKLLDHIIKALEKCHKSRPKRRLSFLFN